jgi:hypothetical protein
MISAFTSVAYAAEADTSDLVAIKKQSIEDLKLLVAEENKDTRLFVEQQIEAIRRELIENDDANTGTVYERLISIEQLLIYLTDPLRIGIVIILFLISTVFFVLWLLAIDKTKRWMKSKMYAKKVLDLSHDKEKLKKKIDAFDQKVKDYERSEEEHLAREALLNAKLVEKKKEVSKEKAPEQIKKKDVFSGEGVI